MGDEKFVWRIVQLPNPFDLDGPWVEVARFKSNEEATRFTWARFGADGYGRINLITMAFE